MFHYLETVIGGKNSLFSALISYILLPRKTEISQQSIYSSWFSFDLIRCFMISIIAFSPSIKQIGRLRIIITKDESVKYFHCEFYRY